MGKNTSIEWTATINNDGSKTPGHTWNPWQGCKKISPGCKNCYMFDGQRRWGNDPENIHRSSKQTFNMPLRLKDLAKVFVCSWSDFFLKEADPWRDEAWEIIRNAPHLTYQILTKRPENILDRLPKGWPLNNVWLGVTAENQEQAMSRIPTLLNIDAAIHFVSVEPMLENIDLTRCSLTDDVTLNLLSGKCKSYFYNQFLSDYPNKIEWVICGGESGPNYREMKEHWPYELMAQCIANKVPFFMKQMAGKKPKNIPIPDELNVKEFPEIEFNLAI